MKYFVFFIVMFFSTLAKSQVTSQGYFYIVASGVDGIVVATDSRSSFVHNKSKVRYSYADVNTRLLTVGNVAMTFSGNETFNGKYLSAHFEDFKKGLTKSPKVSEVLPLFFEYCAKTMSTLDYQLLLENGFIACGYEKGKPTMCMQEGSIGRECISEGWIRSAYDASDFELKYRDTLNCNQLAKLTERSINKYASDYKVHDLVGGPIKILKITANGIQWMQNKSVQTWPNLETHFKDFLSAKTRFNFLPSQTRDKFVSMLRTDYPQLFSADGSNLKLR